MVEKQRILIADDMLMDREVLTELLSGEFDVTAVGDGAQVIKLLDGEPDRFACLLLDIFMPGTDGFAVLDYLREKRITVPVIALTSLTDSDGHIRCYEAGVSELLEKPYDRKVLLYKVRRMIGTRPTLAPLSVPAIGGDRGLLEAFRSDFSRTLKDLRRALADKDDAGLHAAAHAFAGLEANLGLLAGEA